MERLRIQIVAGVTAALGLLLVIASGQDGASTFLKTYSYAVTITTLLFLAYDRWLWHLSMIRKLTGKPDLRGTWKGSLQSSFKRNGQVIPPIPFILRITQTASSIKLTLFTEESSSITDQARLSKDSDGRWKVTWTYSNAPRPSVRDRSDRHLGAAEVFVASDGLRGSYYTDRLTRGELDLKQWSKVPFGSLQQAQGAKASFTTPHPLP
jgi:SMODS-associating 2TM, beta-strand rich effector domain